MGRQSMMSHAKSRIKTYRVDIQRPALRDLDPIFRFGKITIGALLLLGDEAVACRLIRLLFCHSEA